MAMQFDLVSPERRLASMEATEVQIPGAEGDMTALPDHSPVITTLRPGILSVTTGAEQKRFLVLGGFAEVTPAGASVLAEQAMPVEEVTQERIDALIADAAEAGRDQEDRDAVAQLLSDMVAAGRELGLNPTQPAL